MIRFFVFIILIMLVTGTSIVKNSTIGIDDKIYSVRENLLFLENRLMDTKLDFDYLSSPEKLQKYQKLYFENSLKKKSLKELKTLEFFKNEIKIKDLTISGKSDQ